MRVIAAFGFYGLVLLSVTAKANEFGPKSGGIQCRLTTIHPDTSDEAPSLDQPANVFATGEELTFLVELKNVGNQPVTLKGVRYGDSWGSASGRLNTNLFGPNFFQFRFTDGNGDPLSLPLRVIANKMISSHGASSHELQPGQGLKFVLRPAKFRAPLNEVLAAGAYQASVTYHVAPPGPLDRGEGFWNGRCESNTVNFQIEANHPSVEPKELVWGPEQDGLKAAIQLTKPDYVLEDPHTEPGVPLKSKLGVIFHVKNVSDVPKKLVSECYRQDDHALITDENGNEINLGSSFYSGVAILVHWELQPGQVARLNVLAPTVNNLPKIGRYQLSYKVRFNGWSTQDAEGNQTLPRAEHFQGVLETGTVPIVLRKRTIEDDDRAKPPSFVGKIQLVSVNGEDVATGSFSYRGRIKNKYHQNRLIKAGVMSLPDCTSDPSTIMVRADGYEEQRFDYVELRPGVVKKLVLRPVEPARFQLVRADNGRPVTDARIRRFNKSYAKARSGPFPTKGLEGEVWATSDTQGLVELPSLETADPKRSSLGNAVYYFYVEPTDEDLSPMFVGPVTAGQDLGVFRVGQFVKLRGEIRGTKQELEHFAAEWDQPFEQVNDHPDGTFVYAISQRLQTKREGNVLVFELAGLRPGKIRIIANFLPGPHKTKHVYQRREVGEKDVLVEVDLQEPITKVVITPQGVKAISHR